jgi:hypothetical protein
MPLTIHPSMHTQETVRLHSDRKPKKKELPYLHCIHPHKRQHYHKHIIEEKAKGIVMSSQPKSLKRKQLLRDSARARTKIFIRRSWR